MWPIIQARGHAFSLVAVMALATLANLVLNWFFILTWGAVGASVATSISFGCVVFAYAWMVRGWGVQPFTGFYGARLLFLCTVTAVCLAPIAVAVSSPLFAVILGGLLAAGMYWTGALWFGLINVPEIQQCLDSLPDPLRNFGGRTFSLLQPVLLRIEAGVARKWQ